MSGKKANTKVRVTLVKSVHGQLRNIAPFATLLFLVIFFSFASPSFVTLDNFYNILTQISVTGIMAVGLTFVILTAEIDLSVASVANATGISAVHVNRTVQELRKRGLISWSARTIRVLDRKALRELAEFTPDYLHQNSATADLL